jgi:hypothetical protein
VGIGTITVNDDALLELDASQTYGGLLPPRVRLLRTSSPVPLGAHIQGMTVYNTDDRNDVKPGKYYNDGSKWVRVEGADIVDSISLTNDILVEYKTNNGGFTNLIDLVFTARKENVMLLFTSSGLGYTGAMSTVHFRFRLRSNSPSANVIIGGTMNKIQDYTNAFFNIYSITPWSTSYSKVLTGLTIGKEYTVRLQGRVTGVFGGSDFYDAAIFPVTYPDSNHLTISVIQ